MTRRLKASRYNFLFPDPDTDGTLLYNSLTGSVSKIGPEVGKVLESTNLDAPGQLPDETRERLMGLGALVPADCDELAELRHRYRGLQTAPDWLGLTVMPTLSCNFACGYCFQDHPAVYMSEEVQDALVRFVGSFEDLRGIGATWYGGEPLLGLDVIRRLCTELTKLSEERGWTFRPGGLVTNGWGLTRRNCEILGECGIGAIQVTLDGVGEDHDRRRPLRNGSGTFHRIVSNLDNVRDLMPDCTLSVRVNMQADNPDALRDVRAYLEDAGHGDLPVHPGRLRRFSERSEVDRPLTSSEFQALKSGGSETPSECGGPRDGLPSTLRGLYCQARSRLSYVVSPRGELFKCWAELGMDEPVPAGHVLSDGLGRGPRKPHVASPFLSWSPFQDAECRECGLLPVCQGGCLWPDADEGPDPVRKQCSPFKFRDHLRRAVQRAARPSPGEHRRGPALQQEEER